VISRVVGCAVAVVAVLVQSAPASAVINFRPLSSGSTAGIDSVPRVGTLVRNPVAVWDRVAVGPLVAVPAPVTGPTVPSAAYRWPLDGSPRVTRPFSPPPEPWLAGHRGVDLGAAPGATVRAAGSGTVLFAGVLAGRGVVSIEHPNGLRTTYEPLDVEPSLLVGTAVARGQVIGTLSAGHPGCPVAACLHWGLRRGPVYLDPLSLLGLARVRLLPLAG
jgi:murein DD-endopeptidase MepM/ murein hydrolase activator NlpD